MRVRGALSVNFFSLTNMNVRIVTKIPSACDRQLGGSMYEENFVLKKIEQWMDKLPYKWVKIEVELPGKTLVLEKNWPKQIGFTTDSK